MIPRLVRAVGALALLASLALALLLLARRPSNERDWAEDHARLASVSLTADSARLEGVRDFRRGDDGALVPGYRDEAYALDDVRGVWFALAPFANRFRGLAHTFVSFEFAGGRFLAVSVEARREEDESYSLVGGLLRGFEVVYVLGTEEDLLGLRALRGDTLFLYPSVATPDQARALLVDMLERARATAERPEFYNTLFNNCTTNLRDHVNRATAATLPWGWGVLLPGYSDALALEEGLLDVPGDLEEARRRWRVDPAVRRALEAGVPDFGVGIRSALGAAVGLGPQG